MRSIHHQIISLILAILCYWRTGSIFISFLTFFIGVFIDIDHGLDYYLGCRKITLSPTELSKDREKSYLIFHAVEYILFSVPIIIIFPYYLPVFLSYFIHLVMDCFSNVNILFRYFIAYRIVNNWKNPKYVEVV